MTQQAHGNEPIKVALAGVGAFGIKHLDGIRNIPGVEVVSLINRDLEKTRQVADQYGIEHVTIDLADSLALPEVDAVILCTPTQRHAAQTIACLKAGKQVQVEIPLADSLADAQAVVAAQASTGLVALCGHTRRFNPSHQFVHKEVTAGRINMNALGQARSWTDHLLWRHAAHTVFAAVRDRREPNASVHGVLDCYRVLHELEQQLNGGGG